MGEENKIKLRQSIIALLYRLSGADKQVGDEELSYILKVGEVIGVDKEEIGAIILNWDSFELDPPKNEQDRMTILYYLLFLMKTDHNISEEEINLVREFAFRLGFRSAMTDEMINIVQDHVDKNLTPEQLLSTIRKYNN